MSKHYIDARIQETACDETWIEIFRHPDNCKCKGRGVIVWRECDRDVVFHGFCKRCEGHSRIFLPNAVPEIEVSRHPLHGGWYWASEFKHDSPIHRGYPTEALALQAAREAMT